MRFRGVRFQTANSVSLLGLTEVPGSELSEFLSAYYTVREAPVRFGYGSGAERFERFRFSVPAVPLQKGFFCVSVQFNRKGRFRFRFRFLENGSGSASGFGKKRFRRFRFPVLVRFLSHPAIICVPK